MNRRIQRQQAVRADEKSQSKYIIAGADGDSGRKKAGGTLLSTPAEIVF